MTKRFCDICGEPARDNYPDVSQNGCAELYGKKIRVRAIFEVLWTSSPGPSQREHSDPIDLCASCQVGLLKRLAEKILLPPA